MALSLNLSGCFLYIAESEYKKPVHIDPMPTVATTQKLTLLLVGDTGMPGEQRDKVLAQIKKETKDYVVALGDLVYPHPPPCPNGEVLEKDIAFYKEHVAGGLENLGAPVLAILGNHAYYRGTESLMYYLFGFLPNPREHGDNHKGGVIDPAACMVDYLGQLPEVHLPALDYGLDFGVAQLALVDTDHLDPQAAQVVRETFSNPDTWNILIGHHVLKTYHDKDNQDYVAPWLREHRIQPDLYANGHAHILQFGIYNNIPAITSGSGSKLRERKTCPPHCGDGQLWGESEPGYALLTVTPKRLHVVFKNDQGRELYTWSLDRETSPTQGQD